MASDCCGEGCAGCVSLGEISGKVSGESSREICR